MERIEIARWPRAWLPNGGLVVSDSRNGRLQLLDDTGAPCAALPLATGDNALASPFPTGLAWTSDCSSGGGGHGGGGEESADGAAGTGGAGMSAKRASERSGRYV